MGFAEAIGWLVLVLGAGYLLLYSFASKKSKKRETKDLILNNVRCKEVINSVNKATFSKNGKLLRVEDNPIFDDQGEIINKQLKKELLGIINDPIEREKAIDNIKKIQTDKEKREREARDRRKIGYKYEIEIFEIFGNKRELTQIELIKLIESKFHIDGGNALVILKIWEDNELVEKCDWNPNNFEIGWTLTIAGANLDKNDLTWGKWLKQNGLTLEPESKEYMDYIETPSRNTIISN
jgi:hypothetical protein